MKKIAVISLSALVFAACAGNDPNQTNVGANRQTTNANPPVVSPNTSNSVIVSSHSTDESSSANLNLKQNPDASLNQSSAPSSAMGKPVDVSAVTAKIEKAEKDYKAKPDDEKAKKSLSSAYFERAFALTKAAQYRAALGDFRKGLKLDPDDKEAQSMHDQIIEIFASMNRQPPKEGEEPPPLPVN